MSRMILRNSAVLAIISLCIFSYCYFGAEDEIVFNGKNAYEYPVWEEMIEEEIVNLADLDAAFEAYSSTHELDYMTIKKFKKLKKKFNGLIDEDGNFRSMGLRFEELMEYRRATANPNAPKAELKYDLSNASFAMDVPNPTGKGNWKNIGPFGNPDVHWTATGNGAMQYIEMHPTNPAIMYACSRNGGLWKTTDYANHWEPLTGHFATPHTSCIEVCKADPTVLYLGTEADGHIWYTSNEGTTWENRSTGLGGHIYDIHSDPLDATRAIASTTAGIYLTTNSGMSWTQKVAGKFTDMRVSSTLNFMCISKQANGTASSLFFSKDKGDNWIEETITSTPATVDRFHIDIHEPAVGAIKVFAYGIKNGNTPSRFIGLWKGDYNPAGAAGTYFNFAEVKHPTYAYPNGASPLEWKAAAPGYAEQADGYGHINPANDNTWAGDFWVSDNNPDRLLTQMEKMWGSDDGGIIWDLKASYGGATWADMRFVTYNVAQDTIFFCNDGGMWSIKEDDMFPTPAQVTASGQSRQAYIETRVVPKNGDICVTEGTQMDVSQMNKDVIMTGGQDIGQVFVRDGRSSHVASADVYRGRISPADDSKFHTAALKVKLDGGTDIYEVYNSIQADHFDPKRSYGFLTKNKTTETPIVKLVRSAAGVDSWLVNDFKGEHYPNPGGSSGWFATHDNWETVDVSSTGITVQKPGTFEQSRANPEIAFIADETNKKVFITSNLSSATPTWTQLINAPKEVTYRIATHPYNENIIVIASNSSSYTSKDKGATWAKNPFFFIGLPTSILMDREMTEGFYVMTENNVYYTDETMDSGVEFNKNLPLLLNQDMRIAHYENGDNRLYVTKYGRGVWTSPLYSVTVANGDMPIVDFKIHGSSSNVVTVGAKVKLKNLSLNTSSLAWVIENGGDIINKGNEDAPEMVLNTPGYYKVTLSGTNTNGTVMKVKEQYIRVYPASVVLTCSPTNPVVLPHDIGLVSIVVDKEFYHVNSNDNFIQASRVFNLETDKITTFQSFDKGFDLIIKAWIDYNNDGDFDDTGEEVINSASYVDHYTGTFTPPNSAVKNTSLRMRVSGIRSGSNIPCPSSGDHQIIDLYVKIADALTFSSSSTVLTVKSASMETTYAVATNAVKAGFVYSKFDGDLNIDNSSVVLYTGSLGITGSYTLTASGLDYNGKYYYRPFVVDDNGIHYGPKLNFQLAPYMIPLANTKVAVHMDGTNWRLVGQIVPEGHTITDVSIQHGSGAFTTTAAIDVSGQSPSSPYFVETPVTLGAGVTDYQFRVKLVFEGKTYYSRKLKLRINSSICTPSVITTDANARFTAISMNGVNHTEPAGQPNYENVTNVKINLNAGQINALTITGENATNNPNMKYKVLIDYNNDSYFQDGSVEVSQVFTNTSGSNIYPINLTVPAFDLVARGTDIKMRIVGTTNTPDECGMFAGNYKDFIANVIPTRIPVKIYLQGAYSGGMMTDHLRSASPVLIPVTEPYTTLGYTHVRGGGETCNASVFTVTGNDAIVDWVFVELRNKNNAATVQYTRSGLLQRDGDIVDVDGVSPLGFPWAKADDYYVVVKHRNSIAVRSANAVTMTASTVKYDFTTSQTMAYKQTGHPNEPLADLGGGAFGMHAGDVDANGRVRYLFQAIPLIPSDALTILSTGLGGVPTASLSNVYSRYDVNMDGNVRYLFQAIPLVPSDALFILSNTLGGVPTAEIRAQQ